MKVKMRRLAAGPMGVFPAGSIAEVSNDFARQLVGQGYALPCDTSAMPKPVERTGQPLDRVQPRKGQQR